jgi:hypothetical protein
MKYTEEQIIEMENLVRHLLEVIDEQNAKLIAFNAKLENEERKVKKLLGELYILQNKSKYRA